MNSGKAQWRGYFRRSFMLLDEGYSIKNFRLIDSRWEKGLKGKDLARMVQLSPTLYAHYETLRCFPPKSKREEIALILGKEVDFLFPKELFYFMSEAKRDVLDHKGKRVDGFGFESIPFKDFNELERLTALSGLVQEAISQLDYREREIIQQSYGFVEGAKVSFKKIGSKLEGLTRERIRQIGEGALSKMHRFLYPKIGNLADIGISG